jgi:hypothetical protein
MKKLILALALLSAAQCFAQISDIKYRGSLSGTCANTFTTCSNQPGQPFPNIIKAATSVEVPVSNYGMASVTISGSYTGVTIGFEFSDDGGVTYYQEQCARTDANIVEVSEAVTDNASRSWDCTVAGSGILRVRQSANSTGTPLIGITLTTAAFEAAPTVSIGNTPGSTDPCQTPSVLKSSAAINITTGTTTQLVAPVAGQIVYVCSYDFTISEVVTTANTLQFITGSGGTCGSAPTATNTGLYGAGGVTAGIPIHVQSSSGSGYVFKSGTAAGLCAVTAIGATGSFQGIVTFVQQ